MQICFKNWQQFNPRKDVKRSSWFRLENNIFENPDFFDFNDGEFRALIYLFCQQSKKDGKPFRLNKRHIETIGQIAEKVVIATVEKLEQLDMIQVKRDADDTRTSRGRDVDDTWTIRGRDADDTSAIRARTDPYATNERTNETNVRAKALLGSATPKPVFDLPKIYSLYPRKRGKQEGLKVLKREIKTQADFDACLKAVQNYAADVADTEERFVSYFGKWARRWRDWVDVEPAKAAKPKMSANDWLWQDIRDAENEPREVGEGEINAEN